MLKLLEYEITSRQAVSLQSAYPALSSLSQTICPSSTWHRQSLTPLTVRVLKILKKQPPFKTESPHRPASMRSACAASCRSCVLPSNPDKFIYCTSSDHLVSQCMCLFRQHGASFSAVPCWPKYMRSTERRACFEEYLLSSTERRPHLLPLSAGYERLAPAAHKMVTNLRTFLSLEASMASLKKIDCRAYGTWSSQPAKA